MKLAPLLWAGLGIIILAIVGFLPSILVIVALIGILITCYGLTQAFPAKAKLIGQLIALIIVFGLLINGYVYFIKPRTPMSQEALKRAGIATDLEIALKINPQMLKSRLAITNQLQWLQDRIGEEHHVQLLSIRQRVDAGVIGPERAWQETFKILETAKIYQEKTRIAVSWQSASDVSVRLLLLGALLLGITLIPKAPIPGKKLWGGMGTLLLIVGLFLWVFPEIKNVFSRFEFPRAQFEPPSVPPQKIEKPPPLKPPKPKPSPQQIPKPPATPAEKSKPVTSWANAEKYGPIEIPANSKNINTSVPYSGGSRVKFVQLQEELTALAWTGSGGKARFASREFVWQAAPGQGGPWHILLDGGDRPARVLIHVQKKS